MPDLYPSFPVPDLAVRRRAALPRYPRSVRFLFDVGEFELDGAGRPVGTDGYEAWATWCMKAVATERQAFLVYGAAYGAEVEAAARAGSRGLAETLLRRTIREALLLDPRTAAVEGFRFGWMGDVLEVDFVVTPVVGADYRVEVRVTSLPGAPGRPGSGAGPVVQVSGSAVARGLGG
jgi:hypothetical protein